MNTNPHRAGWDARLATIAAAVAAVGIRAHATDRGAELQAELDDLLAQQNRLVARSQDALDAAEREGRALTDGERRAIQRRTESVEQLAAQADAINAELDQPRQRATAPDAGDSPLGLIRTRGEPRTETTFGHRDARFAAMFPGARDAYGAQFKSLTSFCQAVASGKPDSRLMAATMTEGEGAGGGFAVPLQYLGPLLDSALSREVVRRHANVTPMTTRSGSVGVFDGADGTNGARAGLRLMWGSEAAALTEQKGKLREVALVTNKAHIFVRVSSELLEDGVNFDRQLSIAMRDAVAAGLDTAFVNGTGAGQPLGALNGGALITVSKESGQSSTNPLLLQNLANMVGRLAPWSFTSARWLIHPTLIPSLYGMAYTVRNLAGSEVVGGAAVQPVTMTADGTLRIYGMPVDVTDAGAALSTKGDVVLADWTRFLVGLRRDATIERDTSRYFDSDECAFKLTLRAAGQPTDAAPTKLRDGTNTVGPFVALETR